MDLSKFSENDVTLDADKKEVVIKIPHAELEPINISASDIQFGDVERGILALGDMKCTAEQIAEVQAEAEEKMETKLEEQNIIDDADRFAKLTVWEMYQPIINSVAEGYSLIVEFKD